MSKFHYSPRCHRARSAESGLRLAVVARTAFFLTSRLSVMASRLMSLSRGSCAYNTVLDVGCGTGYLTSVASKYVQVCVGIDLSKESISLARQCYSDSKTSFFVAEISKFSSIERFDVCMANMVFMSDPNWKESLINIYELLNTNGYLYVMITHPCFWPKYAKLENVSGFDYSKELFIENDFSISLEKYMGKSTYIHRPLSQYFAGLLTSGFEICSVEEPFPTEKAQFDNEYEYQYPRFLFIKCKKQNLSHMF